ncbi:HlyD family efflux transporter periplasmic adaptor subunit [Celeribacter baekdonensis]|uniref:HlyD family efflux transporter periplasmic adaptor subunit n=1 Tax=Celeribacter baekdonensis TaxID=875171 RepID=UPI003A948133
MTVVLAGIDGQYVDLRTNRDSMVNAGDLIGAIEPTTESLFVDVYLDGTSIHTIGSGNRIELSFRNFEGENVFFEARLEQISRFHLPSALIPDWVERKADGGYFPATLRVLPSDSGRIMNLINDGQPTQFTLRQPGIQVVDILFKK